MMKYMMPAIVVAILTIAAGCQCAKQANQVGSYSSTSSRSADAVTAAAFAIKAQQAEMRKSADTKSAKLSLGQITSAQKQVVSGINFKINMKVNLDGKERDAEAVVWHQAWRKPNPYELTHWVWK